LQRTLIGDDDEESMGEHKRKMGNKQYQQLTKNNKNLNDAISIGRGAESTAIDTKLNLQSNNEKLSNTRDNVFRMQGELSKSNRIVDVIRRNELKNKIIVYGVVIFLIAAIGVIAYFEVFN